MNLHSIASPVIGAVNPSQLVTLLRSTGYSANPDFSRTPSYAALPMSAQIQGLQSDDIRVLNGLSIQGERRKLYLWGTWTGLVRSLRKGNDLAVFPDGSRWKVAYVFEDYGHGAIGSLGWCSVAVVLQNQESDGTPPIPEELGMVATVSLTSNYEVLLSDSGTYFDNGGASGPVIVTLPEPVPGLEYSFAVATAQVFQVVAPSGAAIALGTAVSSLGGSVSSALIYSTIFVYAPSGAANQWVATSDTGGWNVS